MAQESFGDLLGRIVGQSGGDLQGILIFNLKDGLPLYCNNQLKINQKKLFEALFGDQEATVTNVIDTGFESLGKIQNSFKSLSEATEYGQPNYLVFKLEQGTMMIYFVSDVFPDLPIAICFLASENINIGSVIFQSRKNIGAIKAQLKNL
ncbi:MAG: hypothetical protein AB4063_27040 [Crocosphaera sp.]